MAELYLLTERIFLQYFPNWLLGDHLGSTSMVANADGTFRSEVRYSAFGESRYEFGTMTTDYLYTGQRQEAEIGLYYYVARWYDPAIGRFIQADTIVPDPGSALGFDRFAYSYNNPVVFSDPSGHFPLCIEGVECFTLPGYTGGGSWGTTTASSNSVPEIAVFGGSFGQENIELPGPQNIDDVTTAWTEDISGEDVNYWVPYPGSKYQQSLDALSMNMPKDKLLALICYSAGTEACLMFAKAFNNEGGDVHSIVLLGPTFVAHNEQGEYQGSEYWLNEMSSLIVDGVNVSIIHDISGGAEGEHFVAPTTPGAGEYKYWNRRETLHFGFRYPGYASNNNPVLRDQVYTWIKSLIQ